MKKLLLVIGVLLVGLMGFCLLVWLWLASAKDIPITNADHALVTKASSFIPYFEGFLPSGNFESLTKVEYLDASRELNYEYDSPLDDEPYIDATVTYDISKQDANSTYETFWTIQDLIYKACGYELKENNLIYYAGDRSRFGNLKNNGETVGNVFVVQKGKTVYGLIICGFTIDDRQIWKELLQKRIRNL